MDQHKYKKMKLVIMLNMQNDEFSTLAQDKASAHPEEFPFKMSEPEKKLFISTVRHSRLYLEFGAGGSTFEALRSSMATVYSVESSPEWLAHMREWRFISDAEGTGRLNFEPVDIGKTGEWGMPLPPFQWALFPDYSQAVFKKYPLRFDCILVDGRFRVACVLNTILHSGVFSKIMIHDFWDRPDYRVVLKYLDVVDDADTMLLARPKGGISESELRSDLGIYQTVCD